MKQETFIDERTKSLFLSLYALVIADGEIHPKELETLYKIGIEYGISKEDIHSTILNPHATVFTPDTIEEKVAYLYNLAQIAWADGIIQAEEKELLNNFVVKFGFPKENKEAIVDYFLDSVKNGKTITNILEELK